MSESKIRSLSLQLSKLLQDHGAERYELTYTGSNDSTDGCDSQVFPEALNQVFADLKVSYQTEGDSYNRDTGRYEPKTYDHNGSFEDAAYELANMLWNYAGQGGWYNNEGGYGELVILPGGFVELKHVNYLDDEYHYDDDDNRVENTDREETIEADWRYNVFAGPIAVPKEHDEETSA